MHIIIIILFLASFFTLAFAGGLSLESEWQQVPPQVSWPLLGIPADLNNVVVWIVSILPLIYNSSSSFSKHLGTVLSTTTSLSCFISFFLFFGKVGLGLFVCFSLSFIFTLWLVWTAKLLLFLLMNSSSIWWYSLKF